MTILFGISLFVMGFAACLSLFYWLKEDVTYYSGYKYPEETTEEKQP